MNIIGLEYIIPLRKVFITADVSTLAGITTFARLGMARPVSVLGSRM